MIQPETPNIYLHTNQENRQATVELNIVENDENVTSEPGWSLCQWIFLVFVLVWFVCFIGAMVFVIVVILSSGVSGSVFMGCTLLVLLALMFLAPAFC